MRACVVHRAGDLRVEAREPVAAGPGQVTVSVALGGICGSDLHYYRHGRVGDFTVQEPLVLGHEIVGHVAALGPGADGPAVGTPVAVHPATPCDRCAACATGRRNICGDARYLGSAARTPHVQGGFAQLVTVPAAQIRTLPPGLAPRRAVLAEPLSVALHAVHRAGDVPGRRVLVTGAGPIGCLVTAVLRHRGAAEVVVSDLLDTPLRIAAASGADGTVRADDPGHPAWTEPFDIAVEASGAPAGLRTCVERVRRGGTVVLLGLLPPGEVPLLGNLAVTRELELRGAFRFDGEFDAAIGLLAGGLPVDAIVTHTFPLTECRTAFDLAHDRSVASKVLLDLTGV
ncbi:L-idonate 5-dehydrogenase [Streptomyces griseoruber]|uniref:L-idonate 5-dehydrogenase n=1 Tax=Streptomyces griseoruber TaxID=1943 RepID=A0A101TBQ8_9ACTN|nr:L-idonate 5-dehydrogenase [Streptomyces griseoruber]KUN89230.1 L-idonate 5-dehydrogenase [Streptomyces griseoruber]